MTETIGILALVPSLLNLGDMELLILTKNLSTGPDLPSQSPPTYPAGVLRLYRLSDSSMPSFHKDIASLVHSLNMETLIHNFNSVSLEKMFRIN